MWPGAEHWPCWRLFGGLRSLAQTEAGDENLRTDVFVKGSMLVGGITPSKADTCTWPGANPSRILFLLTEGMLSFEEMTGKNHPAPQGDATAALEELLCLPAKAGALQFGSLGLVSGETPFVGDTPPHTPPRCSCTSRRVGGVVPHFRTRC